mmetsp:Transcript_16253/g.52421  ORF Transcript_16253/g.52421 Transcript_16253/m.52421 type:complete len:271 (+) Transcript_16253:690-1502(+)
MSACTGRPALDTATCTRSRDRSENRHVLRLLPSTRWTRDASGDTSPMPHADAGCSPAGISACGAGAPGEAGGAPTIGPCSRSQMLARSGMLTIAPSTSHASDAAAAAQRSDSATPLPSAYRAATYEPRKQSPAPVVSTGRPSAVPSTKEPMRHSSGSAPSAAASPAPSQPALKWSDPSPPNVTSTSTEGLPAARHESLSAATAARTRCSSGLPSGPLVSTPVMKVSSDSFGATTPRYGSSAGSRGLSVPPTSMKTSLPSAAAHCATATLT